MRIGYDVSQAGRQRTGCGTVADALLRALLQTAAGAGGDESLEFVLYPTFGEHYRHPDGVDPELAERYPCDSVAGEAVDRIRVGPSQPTRAGAAEFWGEAAARNALEFERALGDPDIVHAHNYYCPRFLQRARLVYTLHDLAFLEHPEWTTEANRVLCWDGVFGAVQRADAIVTVSASTRDHLMARFPHYPKDRVVVMPLASRFDQPVSHPVVAAAPSAVKAWLPGWACRPHGFLLTVATLEPRKNPIGLVRAYAEYRARIERPLPLVWIGARGWMCDAFDSELRALGLENSVIRPGFVDDEALRWCYTNCALFAYPSFFEGFGLPILEAMAHGAAVVTSTTTSMPEVGGDAACYVDPTDCHALADAVLQVATDPDLRDALGRRGRLRASEFSFARSAAIVRGVYRDVLDRPRYTADRPTADRQVASRPPAGPEVGSGPAASRRAEPGA